MEEADEEIRTANDVIRCVYLARIARGRGLLKSARRWQEKADRWLERNHFTTRVEASVVFGQTARKPVPEAPTLRNA